MNALEVFESVRNRSDLRDALADPTKHELLRSLAISTLHRWVDSPEFVKRAPYYETIAPELFGEGRLPHGGYRKNQDNLLTLWRELGLVEVEVTVKGWVTAEDLSPGSLRRYRTMCESDRSSPEVRARGSRLLNREVKQEERKHQTTANLRLLAEALLDGVGADAVVGWSRDELAARHGVPKRVVNELFALMKETGEHDEKVVKSGGKAKRVLVLLSQRSAEG